MDEGLTHAPGVIDKLLGFARKQQVGRGPVDLNEAVDPVQRLVVLRPGAQGHHPGTGPGAGPARRCTADHQLIQEVIMNLLINAIDAVDERRLDRGRDAVRGLTRW